MRTPEIGFDSRTRCVSEHSGFHFQSRIATGRLLTDDLAAAAKRNFIGDYSALDG
jgi:hypothetical protein